MLDNAEAEIVDPHLPDTPEGFSDYFSFLTVRNPYDRAWSAYLYAGRRRGSDWRELANSWEADSFLLWLENISRFGRHLRTSMPCYCPALTWKQSLWAQGVDAVIHFENLREEFSALPFSCKKPLPELNFYPHPNWKNEVQSEHIAIINDLYREDFDLGGYDLL